jgi:nitrite reductase/ring-hydroxylating ferredoxin subunit
MVERTDGNGQFARSDGAAFLDVGASASLPAWTATHVTIGHTELALVNAGGRVVAIDDLCLCCGRPLSAGTFANGLLACEGCGWTYDVLRGFVHGIPNLRIQTHEVRVEGGRLLLPSAIAAPATLA